MPLQKDNTYFAIVGKSKIFLFTRKLNAIYQHVHSKKGVKYREYSYKVGQNLIRAGKAELAKED